MYEQRDGGMKAVNARLLGVLLLCHAAAAQIITTVAGTDWHFPAQTLPALNAPLGQLQGLAVDGAGNVYATDSSNNIVERISPDGTLTVVAGNGIAGFSGDGGPATSASLNTGVGTPGAPFAPIGLLGLAADAAGDLYIADNLNGRVRKVSNGIITTVAGGGSLPETDGLPATSVALGPLAVAVDSAGSLYIAVIPKIYKVSGGIVTTFAGNGTYGSSGDGGPAVNASLVPSSLAVDGAGNVYVNDSGTIRKITNGIINTVPGTAGLAGQLGVDLSGNLYIAGSFRVWELSGGALTAIAGTGVEGFSGDGGPALQANLDNTPAIAVDTLGRVYVSDVLLYNGHIRRISGGIIQTIAGDGAIYATGDNGAANAASLFNPRTVTPDSAGNLYIADYDNSRVRKITGGIITTIAGNGTYYGPTGYGGLATAASITPTDVAVDQSLNLYISDQSQDRVDKLVNGILNPVAGNGVSGFSGDGGPAANASFGIPEAVAVDASGNIYISDSFNNRIRKVSNGIITTVAGNGTAGFSGDGGPATAASLNSPYGIAVDTFGDLYIADSGNSLIRKISGGIITTAAGNGSAGFSGDGGPATAATLNGPFGVAVDIAGNLYIADSGNVRVRKVSGGVINTFAGNGITGFSGDGGPATSATLNFPFGVGVDNGGNVYIADYGNSRVRVVLGVPPSFPDPVPSDLLTLSGSSGGRVVTTPFSVSTSGTAAGSVLVSQMPYFVQIVNGSNWLSASPLNGSSPGLVTVTADPSALAPGLYTGTIVIAMANANPPMQTVDVQFTVTPSVPASLSVDQNHMSFTYATTSVARSQTLIVSNSGGGSLNFTTSISLNSGVSAKWLSVTPQNGTATPGNPVALAVLADPSSLGPGTYTGSLTIDGGSAGSVTIPITMTITANPLVMLLSQAGLTFTAVQNGGAIPPQTFGVLSLGSGTLNWSVQTSTLPTGGSWLIATPDSGSSNAAAPSPGVTVSVNPAGLQPGVYYGLVTVVSAGAANTPQEVVAVLRVLPPGTDVAPVVQPSSLIFTAPSGVSSPSSQNVLVYDPTGTSKSFSSGIVTNGSGQLVTLPTDATISPAEPAQIVVQPIVNGLNPGTYPGTLTLQFSDGRVNAVGITFVVTGSGASSARPQAIPRDSGSSCTAMKLIPTLTTLSPSFNVLVGYPTGLSAQVMDDCGNPQTTGNVTVTFTNGDPPLGLTSLNNGTWQATWYAGTQSAGQPVKLTVTAAEMQPQISGTAEVSGGISASQEQPMILSGGVVGAASPVSFTALAPGGIISIYGSLLADSAAPATSIPLPTTLGNANVIIAGQTVPLFYASPGQINAVVPFGLNTNTSYSVVIQRDLAISSPVAVDIADAQPGAFQSSGSAIVEDYRGTAAAFLVTPSAPAQAGDLLVIYCAGLGVTNPPVGDGVASPSSPPAQTQAPVTVSIGGQNANVAFAGLTPTLVGLYQVNVTMPAGVTPGSAVPVLLTVAGQTGPAAIIATQ
jgi:trimeric autotransporter adhesin